MKRFIFIVLACAYLIALCSCSSDKTTETKEDDYIEGASDVVINKIDDKALNIGMFMAGGYMCETENGYYYIPDSDIVQYFDKESGVSVPLCSKPECGHSDQSCNGYVGASFGGLSYFNERLYWVGQDSYSDEDWKIKSMAVDGTDRRTEKSIVGFNHGYDSRADTYDSIVAFDGDYVYMMPQRHTIENGVPNFYYYITRTDISTGEAVELLSIHLSDTGEYSPNTYWTISGNNLYFYYKTSVVNSPEYGLYRIDLTDLSVENLYTKAASDEDKKKYFIGSLKVDPNGRLLMCHSLSFAHGAPEVYAFNEDKGEFEPTHSFSELSESDTNGVAFGSEGIVAIGYDEETLTYTVCTSDYDFKPLSKTKMSLPDVVLAPEDSMLGSQLLAVGEKELILYVEQFGGDNDRTYIVACPYGGGKSRILFEY